jgi:nucleoside-diphosphate-sugar epimerase
MNEHLPRPQGLLIIGCGYTGCVLARRACSEGIPVWGTTRTMDRVEKIRQAGAEPLVFEAGKGSLPESLREKVDTVVDTVGPPWSGEPDSTGLILEALKGFSIERFVYLSSTSVYGDCGGEWVDEDTHCQPTGPAGKRRLAAEELLYAHEARLPTMIARLPGIYGPGRSVLERLKSGRFRMVGEQGPFSNRIHVEDLATALWALCMRGIIGQTYLLTDDEPERLRIVGQYAADLLGVPLPSPLEFEVAKESIPLSSLSMLTDSKRLSNARMKRELGIQLRYPSYREGLQSLCEVPSN